MTDNSRFMKEQETPRHDWPFPVYVKKDKPQDVDCNCEGFCTGVHEMTDREVLKQALDALTISAPVHNPDGTVRVAMDATITALRTRLAQYEQEPVKFLAKGTRFKMAFFDSEEDGCGNQGTYVTCFEGFEDELDGRWVALVAAEDDCHRRLDAPPPRKPLTDEEIKKASLKAGMQEHYMGFHSGFVRFARAIERAHGIGGNA